MVDKIIEATPLSMKGKLKFIIIWFVFAAYITSVLRLSNSWALFLLLNKAKSHLINNLSTLNVQSLWEYAILTSRSLDKVLV